jgi:predicted acyltransferase
MGLTVVAEVTVTVHVLVPVQPPPLQPAKVYPLAAVAVSVTCVPFAKFPLQVWGQLIPDGLLVTVPAVPGVLAGKYVTVKRLEAPGLNVGVTVVAEFTVTTQLLVPEQPPPLQPTNV